MGWQWQKCRICKGNARTDVCMFCRIVLEVRELLLATKEWKSTRELKCFLRERNAGDFNNLLLFVLRFLKEEGVIDYYRKKGKNYWKWQISKRNVQLRYIHYLCKELRKNNK